MMTQPRIVSLKGQNVFNAKTNKFMNTALFLRTGPATCHIHAFICWHIVQSTDQPAACFRYPDRSLPKPLTQLALLSQEPQRCLGRWPNAHCSPPQRYSWSKGVGLSHSRTLAHNRGESWSRAGSAPDPRTSCPTNCFTSSRCSSALVRFCLHSDTPLAIFVRIQSHTQ